MTQWIERKYINLVSPFLRNFHWKNERLANCSCPVCGDSEKDKLKARFYFIPKQGNYSTFCHNCNYNAKFNNFLKKFNPVLHEEYLMECVAEKIGGVKSETKREVVFRPAKPLIKADYAKRNLVKLTKLGANHQAIQFVRNRKIPVDKYKLMYYTDNFASWVNTYMPGKLKDNGHEPRIVFPLHNKQGEYFGCTGRSLDPNIASQKRYITIMNNEDESKVFGQYTVDTSKTFFATEGIFDSFFFTNSVALLGSSLVKTELDFTNGIFVFDNEPRNKQIVRSMEVTLRSGHRIFIWPESIKQKDVNDAFLAGITNMEEIVLANTFQGLSADLELSKWKKC